jgi:hypothetical protein
MSSATVTVNVNLTLYQLLRAHERARWRTPDGSEYAVRTVMAFGGPLPDLDLSSCVKVVHTRERDGWALVVTAAGPEGKDVELGRIVEARA